MVLCTCLCTRSYIGLPEQPLFAPLLVIRQQPLGPLIQPGLAFACPRRHDPLDETHRLIPPPQEIQLLYSVQKLLRLGLVH